MTKRERPRGIIFLIGAGASFDAGMPLVAQLTKELRSRLPELRDMNGQRRPEFLDLFDALSEYEPEIRGNYERLFEWLRFLRQGQICPFRKVVRFALEKRLVNATADLEWKIKLPIWHILRSRHRSAQPSYFAKLGEYLPDRGRLKVFTTNFDLCVEDACRCQDITVITGFRPGVGLWSPSLFRGSGRAINLYKLHGSLNWANNVERYPPDWEREPEILLGPGSKLQHEDPFLTLYAAFYQALRSARLCVAVGCSFHDDHIRIPVLKASRRSMSVIDVNPSPIIASDYFSHYTNIPMGAKCAFESGEVLKALSRDS